MQSDSEVINKRGFRLLVSLKKDEEFTKKISVNFGFLPTTSVWAKSKAVHSYRER